MSQPSITQYFGARKRSAIDLKVERARKVLILSQEGAEKLVKDVASIENGTDESQLIFKKPENETKNIVVKRQLMRKEALVPKGKKHKSNCSIEDLLSNVKKRERCVTPPVQPAINVKNDLNDIKKKLTRSSKLEELKDSINKFKKSTQDLKAAEKKTASLSQSPKLETFKSIEIEVAVSPQKQSPEKPYLSPRKESTVRRNLLNSLSPVKDSSRVKQSWNNTFDGIKSCLQLPFKYKTLGEMFRATDTVAQILYNREELITFKKLKPAVEQMVKRTFLLRHIAQFKFVYPAAYEYNAQKISLFGTRIREQWDLVLTPYIKNEGMTSKTLLDRRRKFNELLTDIVKDYHNEFLLSLTPPMVISKENITRWHPDFDIEKVPDIELADLPQIPVEDNYSSGKEVLEKARQMFKCNTRMEQALSKLKEIEDQTPVKEETTVSQQVSLLKGIPKALLEKVRQKQAAKALISMTRTVEKEKELQMYARLPELARLLRSIFVSEKKSVIELDIVMNKLANSYHCFLNDVEMKDHLKVISREVPHWLVFHNLRNSVFLKLSKNADLSVVLNKLEKLAKEKSES